MDASMEIHHHHHEYTPPLALTILSCVFLALGAVCFLIVLGDIVWQRGWKSMMGVMIPVYPINAAYMLPVTLWLYFKYGRPTKPGAADAASGGHCHGASTAQKADELDQQPDNHACCHSDSTPSTHNHPSDASPAERTMSHHTTSSSLEKGNPTSPHCHTPSPSRPLYATVLAGVSHCGAGCVLGDIVGELIIYGTGATIAGEMLWPALLIDYAFALLFGIAFQYFSIAPMSGDYGPKTIWRAAKADILSLTSFEVGAFGWMVVYQAGIFGYRLGMMTWVYWWMMQIGMVLGFATAVPVNYWLIAKGIKEPCC